MDGNALNSFFTMESLMTLQGATAACLLVPNVVAYLIGPECDKYRKWISLLVAFGIAFMTAFFAETPIWSKWVLAFLNGLLIFASAVGINQMAWRVRISRETRHGSDYLLAGSAQKTAFFGSWF
jgi:membrane protein YdbS with pleckstrin-like domain